jgi:hypothetical protein
MQWKILKCAHIKIISIWNDNYKGTRGIVEVAGSIPDEVIF